MYTEELATAVREQVAREAALGRLGEKITAPAEKPRRSLFSRVRFLPRFSYKTASKTASV